MSNAELIQSIRTDLQALSHAINAQSMTDIIWILPPYQGAGVHESAQDRLDSALRKLTALEKGQP